MKSSFRFERDWFLGALLVLAVIVVYQPVWQAGFIWDDDLLVTANPCIVGPLGLKEIWTTKAADICPLTLTMFRVEHALWGLHPLDYHLVNVLMHGASAVLLWRVLLALRVPGAWLGAALWALHPVQVESVAWIAEMKNTQSGVFYLLTIFFFSKELQSRNGWNYGLTLLFAALAMAGKSSTVVLPLVLCLCAWWVEGKWHWRHLLKVAPIFLMSVAAAAVSIWTQKLNGTNIPPSARSWPERLAGAGDAVWFYLGKLLWPHPLMLIYPRWEIDAGRWLSYVPVLALLMILGVLWLKRDSWSRSYFFALAYFLAALLPVLGFVDNTFFQYSFVADHFQYLADMGPLALAGAGLARWRNYVVPAQRWLPAALCAGWLLILGVLSWQRTWAFGSQETLWTDALAKNPGCWVDMQNLGLAFFQNGKIDEAIDQYQRALEIKPDDAETHNSLGFAFFQEGRLDEAMAQYQRALEIDPDFAKAYNNRGLVFAREGRMDAAMGQFQKAVEINPDYAEAHYNLGLVFMQKGRVDEAIAQDQRALEINPGFAEAHNNLGNAFLQEGRVDEATIQFEDALRLKPDYGKAKSNLAHALLVRQRATRK